MPNVNPCYETAHCVFAANKTLEKKVLEAEELKTQFEAELREKIKKMEKELENATMKAAGKHCCKNTHRIYFISNSYTFLCVCITNLTTFIPMCVISSRRTISD